jgi:hypothetical protein
MPTWWLTDAAMFNPVCAHHVRSPPRPMCDSLTVYQDDMGLVLSPTDLTKHLACGHLTTLDLQVMRGELAPPAQVDEALELIFRLGLDHEKAYLARLRDQAARSSRSPRAPS